MPMVTYRGVDDVRVDGKYHDWPGDHTVKYVCHWKVMSVRDGIVKWGCECGNRQVRRVR